MSAQSSSNGASPPKHVGNNGEAIVGSTPSAGPSKLAVEISMGSEDTQMQDQNHNNNNGNGNGITNEESLTESNKPPTMDLISELESDLSTIFTVMKHSIGILCFKSAHVQINENVPLFQPQNLLQSNASNQLLQPEEMEMEIDELVEDLVEKTRWMKQLIEKLPKQSNNQKVLEEIERIDEEMKEANKEFKEALKDAEQLREEMDDLLRQLCNDHQQGRAKLAAAATNSNSTSQTT